MSEQETIEVRKAWRDHAHIDKDKYETLYAESIQDPDTFWGEAAKRIDLGPYADWAEPERLIFNVERAYRELRGEPWDAPVDAVALLRQMYQLKIQWQSSRA